MFVNVTIFSYIRSRLHELKDDKETARFKHVFFVTELFNIAVN